MLSRPLLLTAFLLAPAFSAQATIRAGMALQHETRQTQSVTSPARITITGTGDAAQDQQSRENADRLTQRDPATAHQALQNSLTLQQSARLEQQLKTAQQTGEAARLMGEVAAGMIGDLAEAMQKPWRDAAQRQFLENKQEAGEFPLTPAEQHQLARLDREGMTLEKAQATLADPNAKTNHDNWQTGGTVKTILWVLTPDRVGDKRRGAVLDFSQETAGGGDHDEANSINSGRSGEAPRGGEACPG